MWGKTCLFSTLSVFVTVSIGLIMIRKKTLGSHFPFASTVSPVHSCFNCENNLWKQSEPKYGENLIEMNAESFSFCLF